MIHKPTIPKIYTPQDGSCVLDLDARDVCGSKIYDRSGKGNHGAIIGAVVKPMNYGLPVLDFDGVDDVIIMAANTMKAFSEKSTLLIWFKIAGTQAEDIPIIDSQWGADTGGGWQIYIATDNTLNVYVGDKTGRDGNAVINNIIKDDTWHCLGTTKESTNQTVFIDGVLINKRTDCVFGTTEPNTDIELKIGSARSGAPFLKCSVAQLQIFGNKCFTPSEYSQFYNDTKNLF